MPLFSLLSSVAVVSGCSVSVDAVGFASLSIILAATVASFSSSINSSRALNLFFCVPVILFFEDCCIELLFFLDFLPSLISLVALRLCISSHIFSAFSFLDRISTSARVPNRPALSKPSPPPILFMNRKLVRKLLSTQPNP